MVRDGFELIAQGAEARIYKGSYLGRDTLVKERFKKTYRHPDLDETLSKDRVKNESRAIVRAKIAGEYTDSRAKWSECKQMEQRSITPKSNFIF